MKVENVLNCSFKSWFPRFKHVTMKSLILPLSEEFVEYLLADGVILPDSDDHRPPKNSEDSDEEDWDVEDEEPTNAPHFPEFDKKLKDCIAELGGSVFPKLNWSSPRDASWITLNNSLRCSCVTDLYLLLKSSDFVTHDLTQPFKFCVDYQYEKNGKHANHRKLDYYLVLRKWIEIDPSTEFRCFIKNNELIAISQRDHTNFYDHIKYQKDEIIEDVTSFFDEHIKDNFPDPDYVFDIYRNNKNRVRLIDFNPFGKVTDSLLFDWNELNNIENSCTDEEPEFRYNSYNRGVQPSPYLHYGMPLDIVDLTTGEDPYKLIDLLKLKTEVQQTEYNSSDDEKEGSSL